MTYQEAISAAKAETTRNPKLSNFYLYIASGYANASELAIIREIIANNDAEAKRRAA